MQIFWSMRGTCDFWIEKVGVYFSFVLLLRNIIHKLEFFLLALRVFDLHLEACLWRDFLPPVSAIAPQQRGMMLDQRQGYRVWLSRLSQLPKVLEGNVPATLRLA